MRRLVLTTLALTVTATGASAQLVALNPDVQPPAENYWAYVSNESSDLVSLIRFGPDGIEQERTIAVGVMPADLDGAHGMTVAPSGDFWYVSLAHGFPYGKVWKYSTATNQLVDTTTVGLFPATMAPTPDGSMLFVVNFNLHGNPVPSSVSAIFTPTLQEITQIETCVKPHGGRVNNSGTFHYSGCVGSDQLVEISTSRLTVSRRLFLTRGEEGLLETDDTGAGLTGNPNRCKPTWVTVTPDDQTLYVPCNGRGEILEIDAATLEIRRAIPTGRGPYNADISADGVYLVVSLKGAQSVAVFDLRDGSQTQIETSQPVTHGVTISTDSRYAFISNEAIGATRGTVDVIDLAAKSVAASVEVVHQPGGISFWRMGAIEGTH
jgi:DNA-binding beta-propeller fold protein YncE